MTMKQALYCVALLPFISLHADAQKYSLTWGDESNMKKSTVDMKLVNADESGTYFLEGDLQVKLFVAMATNYKLKKFDANFKQVFEKEYSRQLKGLTLSSVKPLKNKLYLFANDYDKKENIYTMYAAEINRNTGDLLTDPKEIGNYTLSSDRDIVRYVLKPSQDSTAWSLITNIIPDDGSGGSVYITILDEKLDKKQNAVIHLKQDPDVFSFEDMAFTNDGKFLVLGKEFEYLNGSTKKKDKVFKDFTLTRYGSKGNQEAVYKLYESNNKYSIAGKLITLPRGEVVFAGFYSNAPRGKAQALNGIYTARIDLNGNTLTQSSAIEVNQAQLTDLGDSTGQANEPEHNKSKKGDEKEEQGFSNSFLIRNVVVNPVDNSLVIIAETFSFSYHTYYMPATSTSSASHSVAYDFQNRELLLVDISPDGKLNKISMIPKKQRETFSESHTSSIYSTYGGYFTQGGSYPYYSSISSSVYNNNLFIFFNDNNKNEKVTTGSDVKAVKWTDDFQNSSLCAFSINLRDFTVKKESIFHNTDIVAMPRFGFVAGNTVYLPASRQRLLGKTELKLGKIVIQ